MLQQSKRERERGTTRRALLRIDFAVTPKNGQYSWHCYRAVEREGEEEEEGEFLSSCYKRFSYIFIKVY